MTPEQISKIREHGNALLALADHEARLHGDKQPKYVVDVLGGDTELRQAIHHAVGYINELDNDHTAQCILMDVLAPRMQAPKPEATREQRGEVPDKPPQWCFDAVLDVLSASWSGRDEMAIAIWKHARPAVPDAEVIERGAQALAEDFGGPYEDGPDNPWSKNYWRAKVRVVFEAMKGGA